MTERLRLDRLKSGTGSVGLLFNPLSGRIRKRKEAIRRVAGKLPGTCREVTNAQEISASVDAFVNAGMDLLVIIGGDGTVQGVLGHLFATQPRAKWPLLTIVPGGTTNMTALDLGICGSPESVLQQLGACFQKNFPFVLVERHVLCIEQSGAGKVYGMFFGVGLIARAVIFSQSRIKRLGITGEIYSALITFGYIAGFLLGRRQGAWAPVRMSITEKALSQHHGTFAFLFASTLDRLLFGMRPYWGEQPEPLHVTFVRQQRQFPLRSVLRLLIGRGNDLKDKDGYHSYNTDQLELQIDDDYIVDGESYRADSRNGPLCIMPAGPIAFLVAERAAVNAKRRKIMSMLQGPATADPPLPEGLISEMAALSSNTVSADFLVLLEALKLRFGSALDAVLLYGSCLRAREIGDGVVDFYAVVSSYSSAYPERYLRYFNALLPPNVFYLEVSQEEKTFRAKYAVVSMADFEQGARRWFHPYLWARFAQPSRLLFFRDEAARKRISESLAHAVVTFLGSTLPTLDCSGTTVTTTEMIWTNGLTQTYAAELRPERAGRARQLAQRDLEIYARLTALTIPALAGKLKLLPDGDYECLIDDAERRKSQWYWRLRRWQGKVLSVLRLSKAAFTFHDAISYAAWKIERHTGVRVEVTPMLRRHPLLWGFKVSWRLLRRGVMR